MKAKIKALSPEEAARGILGVLDSGEAFPLRVTGSSMVPFLHDGRDTVWLRKTDSPRRGQMLFFRRRDGSFILHRIRRINSDGSYTVNGDAQTWCETVPRNAALAVAERITRKNGKTVDTDSLAMRFLAALWYPTRPLRPYIFKMCGLFKRK